MSMVIEILSWVCLLSGGAFCVIGAVGLLRMPDLYTRMHAGSVTDTLGAMLILAGLMLQAGFGQVTGKLLVILVLLFFTNPAATHALAKAARGRGVKPMLDETGGESSRS